MKISPKLPSKVKFQCKNETVLSSGSKKGCSKNYTWEYALREGK